MEQGLQGASNLSTAPLPTVASTGQELKKQKKMSFFNIDDKASKVTRRLKYGSGESPIRGWWTVIYSSLGFCCDPGGVTLGNRGSSRQRAQPFLSACASRLIEPAEEVACAEDFDCVAIEIDLMSRGWFKNTRESMAGKMGMSSPASSKSVRGIAGSSTLILQTYRALSCMIPFCLQRQQRS